MYKVTITFNNGKRQVINNFPTETMDFYTLTRAIDKCEIQSFSVRLAD